MPWPGAEVTTGNFVKPFLSEADEENENQSNDNSKRTPSRKTCLVIDKASCRMYARGKQIQNFLISLLFVNNRTDLKGNVRECVPNRMRSTRNRQHMWLQFLGHN